MREPTSRKPAVTLAIPTSNRLSYLRETLRDALRQNYENLEILVSDNGSTDGTRAAVREIAARDARVRLRRNESPAPIITHFNQCLSEARGDFFVLLSDDDRINPAFVSTLAGALMENARATVAVPANSIINQRGEVVQSLPPPPRTSCEGVDFVIEWLWKIRELPVANVVTVMGRTQMMRKFRYQPFPKGLHADDLLFIQLALGGQVVFRGEAVFFWREHASQQLRTSSPAHVHRAGRQLRAFARKDRLLRDLILAHHPRQQKQVLRGVSQMTAETYLHRIAFFDRPFEARTFLCLLPALTNPVLARLALCHYYRRLRRRVFGGETAPARI